MTTDKRKALELFLSGQIDKKELEEMVTTKQPAIVFPGDPMPKDKNRIIITFADTSSAIKNNLI